MSSWFEGITDFPKLGGPAQYRYGRSIDHRTDTRAISLLPKTIKESASVVTDLPKWATTPPTTCGDTYIYGDTGNFYKRDSNGVYTFLRNVPNSHGNGMEYFGEDNFVYYILDKTIGRYGPICTSNPQFNDDFFGSQGGNRTNTYSLELLKASSQYASRASTASLQLSGDLSIEAQIYPYSKPTTGETQTLVSKWDESGATRSYKFDITTTSNYFGDGSDGALTISVDTTDTPIDSACTGTSGATTLSATNASFASGQMILIHQTQGTGAGTWQKNKIQSYTAGTITLESALNATYGTGAQVLVLKQYSSVTVNSGKTWTAKAWNGTTGGILGFLCNGTITITGSINASGKGFRGGVTSNSNGGTQGEGTSGYAIVTDNNNANGNGGGAGLYYSSTNRCAAGGGGGNGDAGSNGDNDSVPVSYFGIGGNSSGANDLTTMTFGGGGGAGASDSSGIAGNGTGGNGGGIIFISGITLTVSGSIVSSGSSGGTLNQGNDASGGGGAGGSILLKAQTATLGTSLITATGGAGGGGSIPGGSGSIGRIHIDYYTSFTGTTSPTITSILDTTLGSTDGYILRLQLSSNGSNSETYSKSLSYSTNTWQHAAVSFTSSTSTAEFFLNGVSLGTQVGTFNSISANASTFQVGMYKNGAGTASGFYNGLIDEVRVWSSVRTATDYILGMSDEIISTYATLKAYYKFNNAATDSTTNTNDLTLSGGATYSTTVPFFGATTRLDMDQSAITAGNTYTLPTTISETATNKLTFTPQKDPQKSIAVQVAGIGTGAWTITVHDSFNNVVVTKTVANASMAVGLYEFIFSSVWRPQINQNYHFHLTSSDGTGTVTTTTAGDLATVSYRTYYQFLVNDQDFHPIAEFLQFLVIGNERYVSTIEATLYDPHTLTLPAGWKVRSFAYWNEYLAIGCWKGETVSQYDNGRIYFWDGTAPTYNFYIDVPEGSINAMIGSRGKLYFIAGYRAKLLVYEGGAQARKIKNLINTENTTTVDIYPGAMTMWRALLRIGVAADINNDTENQGVYTYGATNERFADSLSFDYVISTGNYTGNVSIGLTHVVNSKLLIGWRDGAAYGVDYIDIGNDCYTTGTIEHLIEDDGAMYHEKESTTITCQFAPLVAGQSIQLKYRLNRSTDWTELSAITTVGATTTRSVISTSGSRYREYEIGANLASTSGVSPTIYALSLEKDELETEKRVG